MNETKLDAGSIREVERLTRNAVRTTVLTVDQERPGVYFLVGPDGRADRQVADPAWPDQELDTPDELVRLMQEANTPALVRLDPVVFYDADAVRYLYDRDDVRATARVNLIKSDPFFWLSESSSKPLSQADAVRVLRITFRGCLPDDGNLLRLLKSIKFGTDGQVTASLGHGTESLGRSVTSKLTAEQDLPDELFLTLPVYDNHPKRVRIACALEVFPREGQFKITPYPGELNAAVETVLDDIATRLADTAVPTYRGSPTTR